MEWWLLIITLFIVTVCINFAVGIPADDERYEESQEKDGE